VTTASKRSSTHGYDQGRDEAAAFLKHDMVLNSQGLDAWLSWLER
jgi:hypothetical protein